MKAGSGQHFEQSYNAQAAGEGDSRLIVGERVSPAPNDKEQLAPAVATVVQPVESVAAVLTDSGFYSEAAVKAVEENADGQPSGITVYAAVEKKEHHRTVGDLERKEDPAAPAAGASVGEIMKHRLPTATGKAKYKLRQPTGEPVFGILQSVLGFRQFYLRGKEKVGWEWKLVCLASNFKRLHRMAQSWPVAG